MSRKGELPEYIPLADLHPTNLVCLEGYSDEERDRILFALKFAKRFHGDQRRISGEMFIVHPIAVAQLLISEFNADCQTTITGLLHDTVEDTPATLQDITDNFGEEIRFLVDGCTDFGKGDGNPEIKNTDLRRERTHEKIFNYLEKDQRIALVKAADRWHNLVTCYALRSKNQRKMAQEALDFHVPLCRDMGLEEQADKLEKVAQIVINRVKIH